MFGIWDVWDIWNDNPLMWKCVFRSGVCVAAVFVSWNPSELPSVYCFSSLSQGPLMCCKCWGNITHWVTSPLSTIATDDIINHMAWIMLRQENLCGSALGKCGKFLFCGEEASCWFATVTVDTCLTHRAGFSFDLFPVFIRLRRSY